MRQALFIEGANSDSQGRTEQRCPSLCTYIQQHVEKVSLSIFENIIKTAAEERCKVGVDAS